MKRAPQVIVAARYPGAEGAARVFRYVENQTYRDTKLVFVHLDETVDPQAAAKSVVLCSVDKFASLVEASDADYVLFWPPEGGLKEAAIEKLVLALELAPDQDGVADAEHGSTGLWLARVSENTQALISFWYKSQAEWIGECMRRKSNLFFIGENLAETADPMEVRRPFAVEHLFGKLPTKFENLQPISSDPIWTTPATGLDDRSVLFVVSSLPMGGMCKFILDIAGELKAAGYRVTVAVASPSIENVNPWLDRLLQIVPEVFVLSHSRPIDWPRQIVHLARTRGCKSLVLSHCMLGYQLLPWLRMELPEVAFVDYTHIEYESAWAAGGYALRSVTHQSLLDMSMVSSEHLRKWMIERGADAGAVRVCHTNIDTNKWAPSPKDRAIVRREFSIEDDATVILYPCRLTEQKRPELLCNIIAELSRATKKSFVVVVAGDGPLMPALKAFIENHSLHHLFRLPGAVSLEKIARLYNAAEILLLPSLVEGISLALFEAMALESVPVVSDVGGQRELVTAECGHLIPVGKPDDELREYVTALKGLLENPELRRKMGTACRQRVQDHFQLSQMTDKFVATLHQAALCHDHRPVPLPEPAYCGELAAVAIDNVRLTHEGLAMLEMRNLFPAKFEKQEKIIAKLQRQIEALRSTRPVREENEIRL